MYAGTGEVAVGQVAYTTPATSTAGRKLLQATAATVSVSIMTTQEDAMGVAAHLNGLTSSQVIQALEDAGASCFCRIFSRSIEGMLCAHHLQSSSI